MRSPFPLRIHLAAMLVALFVGLPVGAGAQSPATSDGFNAFRMVKTRNIFDPERRAARPVETTTRPQTPPATRSNYIALTGTMVTAGKSLAFFAGSQADYNKVLGPGETIAKFKIAAITPTGVELEGEGKRLAVGVGRQVPLEGAAAGTAIPISAEQIATPPPATAEPGGAASAAGGAPSDVLKRMMERRQKEMSK